MDSNKLAMTVEIPSGFGVSARGPVFRATSAVASERQGLIASMAVRERVAGVKATGHTWAYPTCIDAIFPGTSAWRPPSC